MTDYKSCRVGTISEYFANHAVITTSENNVKTDYTVTPETQFAGAFDDEKTFAAMREGMTVNIFFKDEQPAENGIAFISPNLK